MTVVPDVSYSMGSLRRVRLLSAAPFRYHWTLLAWLTAAFSAGILVPSSIFFLAVNASPSALSLSPNLLTQAPAWVLFGALMLVLYANLQAQQLPVAGVARWVRRAQAVRAALTQLREDVLAFGVLACTWGAFRRFAAPVWNRTQLPNALGESIEYLLVMGVVVAWVYLVARTGRAFWQWVRTG